MNRDQLSHGIAGYITRRVINARVAVAHSKNIRVGDIQHPVSSCALLLFAAKRKLVVLQDVTDRI